MRPKTVYWIRLLSFALLTLYALAISGYAWFHANAAIRPAQHEICCGSPQDFLAEYEPVTIMTEDGVQLFGWYIQSQNEATVILLHGYGGDRISMLAHAEMLFSNGYGVLIYDQRASGESEGNMRSWGWQDVTDVRAILDFLQEHMDGKAGRIGVLGCSTGAEIAIGAGAQFQDIQAVVADGAFFATARDTLPPYDVADWAGWPFYPLFLKVIEWKSGISAPMPLSEAVAQIAPRSLFLIAAGEDGYEQLRAQQYYERAGKPKEYWIVEKAPHCGGPNVQPLEYENRVIDFFDRALLPLDE
ncbi:MAG: alpha/beta hydrolase [Anaerolineales bacterium]|nr:alpha/beta hydrolase [Anaerolineales bacterium]